MHTCRVAILASLLLCALPISRPVVATPMAMPALAAQNDFTLEGKITDKTGSKLTVSTGENIIFHVVYNDQTEIKKKDGSPGAGQDLHTGVRIAVVGDLAESGEITASKISIEPESSEKQ
jgi:hypothetical protein